MMYRGSAYKSLFANSKGSTVEKVQLETAPLEVFAWKRDDGVLTVNPFVILYSPPTNIAQELFGSEKKSEIKTICTQEIKEPVT